MNDEVEQVMELIDKLGEPQSMSRASWIEFLEEIESQCESRREAAQSEIDDDG